MKKIISLGLIAMLTLSAAFALDVTKLAHSDKELQILVVNQKNKAQLKTLATQPDSAKILVLQVPPSKLTAPEIKTMQDWIKSGHCLWFYDSRLAANFGMHSAPLEQKEFDNQAYKGQFGEEGKLPGVAAVAKTVGNNQILSGVSAVAVFLLEIEPGKFSALEIDSSMTPLLQVKEGNKAVSAFKAYGKGWVVFKPLLWEEDLDGARFQLNLKEFSAGFPVPTTERIESGNFGGAEQTGSALDKVFLRNGKVINGTILTNEFNLETDDGRVVFKKDKIASIYVQDRSGLDKIELRDGKLAAGYLSLGEELNIKDTTGKVMNLNKSMITKVIFKK